MFLIFFSLEFFLSNCLLLLITLPLFFRVSLLYKSKTKNLNLLNICKHFILFVILFSIVFVYYNLNISFYFYSFSFFIQSFTNYFKLLILIISFIFVLNIHILKEENIQNKFFPYNIFEFFSFVLFNLLGVLCFLTAENLLSAYICLELQSLTLALLFALKYYSRYSTEAGLKFFIFSSLSTAILLLSFGLLYGFFGVIHFENFLILLNNNIILSFFIINNNEVVLNIDYFFLIIALCLFIIAFFIKIGVVPFHMWSIDAYEGAPTFITLYSLIIPKIAYICFLIKIIFYCINFNYIFFFFFFFGGIFSIIIGSLFAVVQTKLKRLFSYSAIANFGYLLLSLSFGTLESFKISFLFLFIYIIITFSLFLILLTSVSVLNNSKIKHIFELNSLFLSGRYTLSILLSFFLFTIASIPPFNMFFVKFFLLNIIIEYNSLFSFLIALIIIIFSVISCFYYIRLIRFMFFKNGKSFSTFIPYYTITSSTSFTLSFFSILNISYILYPSIFLNLIDFFLLNYTFENFY